MSAALFQLIEIQRRETSRARDESCGIINQISESQSFKCARPGEANLGAESRVQTAVRDSHDIKYAKQTSTEYIVQAYILYIGRTLHIRHIIKVRVLIAVRAFTVFAYENIEPCVRRY